MPPDFIFNLANMIETPKTGKGQLLMAGKFVTIVTNRPPGALGSAISNAAERRPVENTGRHLAGVV